MWDDRYPVLAELKGDHLAGLRAQEPWMVAARADEVDREMRVRAKAPVAAPKRHGLRWWLRWLRWKEL